MYHKLLPIKHEHIVSMYNYMKYMHAICFIDVHKLNKHLFLPLAGVVQWIEHGPLNQRVASLIPSQGTFLGCRTVPQ